MTTKQRAYLKSLAMTMDSIFQIGKSSMTPEFTKAIDEALAARELIKISVLKNCADDPRALAELLGERTHSQVVQVIGKKIVLYREGKDKNKKIHQQTRQKIGCRHKLPRLQTISFLSIHVNFLLLRKTGVPAALLSPSAYCEKTCS